MIIKRAIAVESLTKVCEESLNLIKQLIDADNEVYAKGYEDGVAAQAQVQKTLRPWVGLTEEEIAEIRLQTFDAVATNHEVYRAIEAKLKEKNS
jgi:hypothetical protein